MPSRWQVRLTSSSSARIPLAAPMAVVSGWLDDREIRDPGRGERSGHDEPVRRWACGPLRTQEQLAESPGTVIALQVRLLDDGLADRLVTAARPGRKVRLGSQYYVVSEEPEIVERTSWRDLRRWGGARAWQVRFVTPACVRRGGRTSPWPAPESLARGLAARWRLLDPQTAPPIPGLGAGAVWVSDVEGRSEVHNLPRKAPHGQVRGQGQARRDEVVSGFVGRIRYVCDHGSDQDAAAFDAIMEFAVFAGAGSHTTYGFGVLQHEPTWQPPTTRTSRS